MPEKKSVNVIIDVNEPGKITAAVDTHPEVENYFPDRLDAADLQIEGIGFERKTVSDYVSSLKEGRLDSQTQKLDQMYEVAYILIEGDMSQTRNVFKSSMQGSSIRGSWASLTARDSGVRAVIPCSNHLLLVDYAIRLARKHVEESNDSFIPTTPVEPDAPTAMKMYAQIEGVGPALASTLHNEYPTMKEFMEEANYDSLTNLEGVGNSKALAIIEAMMTK